MVRQSGNISFSPWLIVSSKLSILSFRFFSENKFSSEKLTQVSVRAGFAITGKEPKAFSARGRHESFAFR